MHCAQVRVSLGRIPEICPRFLKKPSKTNISEGWLQFLGPGFGPFLDPFLIIFAKKYPNRSFAKVWELVILSRFGSIYQSNKYQNSWDYPDPWVTSFTRYHPAGQVARSAQFRSFCYLMLWQIDPKLPNILIFRTFAKDLTGYFFAKMNKK